MLAVDVWEEIDGVQSHVARFVCQTEQFAFDMALDTLECEHTTVTLSNVTDGASFDKRSKQ